MANQIFMRVNEVAEELGVFYNIFRNNLQTVKVVLGHVWKIKVAQTDTI